MCVFFEVAVRSWLCTCVVAVTTWVDDTLPSRSLLPPLFLVVVDGLVLVCKSGSSRRLFFRV